jgi:hypothetical protein
VRVHTTILLAIGAALGCGSAFAQEPEPGVQTSSSAAPVQHNPAPASSPATKAPAANPAAAKAQGAGMPAKPNTASAAAPANRSSDRIELDTTQISGNRELPKVMYVVPWRRADPGDFAGKPPNSLLDEALTPVDRDVFRRTNRYYGAIQDQAQSGKSQAGAANATSGALSPKDEK